MKKFSNEAVEKFLIWGFDETNFDPDRLPRKNNDWHHHRSSSEPRCGADQWRTKNRFVVTYMHEMTDFHLQHCIRFARKFPQHKSRLKDLLAEQNRRKGKDNEAT